MSIRRLPLKNVKNMRDLGGYSTQSDKTTQFGRLLRSDAPTILSENEIKYLLDFGVSAIIDMRSSEETAKRPCALKDVEQITYFHCPMAIGNRMPESKEEVPLLYWEIVTDYPAMSLIMRIIANQKGTIIFHCTSGKDRTGVVAAILLLLAGVSRSDILADYQVSYTYIRDDIRALLEREPERPSFTGRSDIEYMDTLLNHFEEVYGTAAQYLEQIGLSKDEIQRLENKLINEV